MPYRGGAPVHNDLLAGVVSMYFSPITSALPHVNSGKLRAIAVTTTRRAVLLPEVPTMAEAGLPVDLGGFYALVLPAGTPKDIVNRLNEATAKALASPELREK